MQKRLKDQERIDLVSKYENGMSSCQLSIEYGITDTAILGLLKRRGIKIRKNSDYKTK
jgi:hypothetical protein